MPRIIGYLKLVMNELNVQSQLDLLKLAGATVIHQEKPSGTKRNTPQLEKLMMDIHDGDTLVVTGLEQIAHNTKHLLGIVESLKAAGATLKVLNSGIDTSIDHGESLSLLLSAIVDFERQVVRDRQSAGISKAKREGRYKGRKPTARAKADEVLALNEQGLTRQKIAGELGIGVASVYRILKAHTAPKEPRRKIVKKAEKIPIDKQKLTKRKSTREPDAEQLSFF
jgi:DNA invertase Pin-like site-specific DNA recombinase